MSLKQVFASGRKPVPEVAKNADSQDVLACGSWYTSYQVFFLLDQFERFLPAFSRDLAFHRRPDRPRLSVSPTDTAFSKTDTAFTALRH